MEIEDIKEYKEIALEQSKVIKNQAEVMDKQMETISILLNTIKNYETMTKRLEVGLKSMFTKEDK